MKLVVAACIIEKGRVMLARRNSPGKPNIHNKWEMPGGKVNPFESVENALVREIREELGVRIQVESLLHCQVNDYGREPNAVLFFECHALGFQVPTLSEEVKGLQWVDLETVSSYDILPGVVETIEALRRYRDGQA